ncbi:glycoside hydrolase family 15 protein [Paxillus rubicundulus Ve08.2h10]|uniref:Glycoside hydrolase family 15 protein n=1 Tax=Paxillus rubicundulus Ve08.2h10 TaxID=930991 RepID=A0A0D0D9K8_9AGAM|nr:glycoside hydrolase family 15 protein [Paxillus rubicundulus Ve08.2h10]
MNVQNPTAERDYVPISDHGLIGNLRTAALVSMVPTSIESYCIPNFDSPSVFARILDKHKGGHFCITPTVPFTTKQNYLPSSNVLQTKFLNDKGVVSVTDFLPRQANGDSTRPMLFWLIRRVEVIRGKIPLFVECAPAFNYARDKHTTEIVPDESVASCKQDKVLFKSDGLNLDLRYVAESTLENVSTPEVQLNLLDLSARGHLGPAASCGLSLVEGQHVTFVLRISPEETADPKIRPSQERADELGVPFEKLIASAARMRPKDDPLLTHNIVQSTNSYWSSWIRKSTYQGSWKEAVHRSALALKLLIYEPTGAIVASPTFSLPEFIGGTRNWCAFFSTASWIRDSSFTLYALIRLGFTHEANAYMDFIFERLKNKNPDGSLQIMYTIHGGKDLEEIELHHLDGHKGSKPVRIGNGAADHVQLDIYGELMDCIYLGQKVPRLVSIQSTLLLTKLLTIFLGRSIWSVRGKKRHFTVLRLLHTSLGLRLADKRSLPCPRRNEWLAARDSLYEDIMHKAWNPTLQVFGQSYEETDVLDSSVLIMPLVFFMTPSDPRFLSTLRQIMKTPERGGLTSNNLLYRYDVTKSDDGVGGEEGTFGLCTLWCVEALTRAGEYERPLLQRATAMFEDFLLYSNHVGLCTEEISEAGDGLGNAVQGFTHVTLISAAYNLSRTLAALK